jgi:hypothetical protein
MRDEGCMEICKQEASGSGNQQFSFEIRRASSGQSVSALSLAKHRKTQQMRLRSSPICCKTMQNEAKQMHSRLSPIHRKTPKMTQNAASQDSNDQKSNHENGNEKVAWKYARKRPVGVEINSSVLKSDVLVLVNLSQHCLSQNTEKCSKCA